MKNLLYFLNTVCYPWNQGNTKEKVTPPIITDCIIIMWFCISCCIFFWTAEEAETLLCWLVWHNLIQIYRFRLTLSSLVGNCVMQLQCLHQPQCRMKGLKHAQTVAVVGLNLDRGAKLRVNKLKCLYATQHNKTQTMQYSTFLLSQTQNRAKFCCHDHFFLCSANS